MTRVLVVDDEPALREMLTLILEGEGCAVEVARNGAEAVRRLANGARPDVLLLDLLMPVMDGYAVCDWLLAHLSRGERPRVIIASASLWPDVALPPVADAVLAKPFGIDALLDAVGVAAPSLAATA